MWAYPGFCAVRGKRENAPGQARASEGLKTSLKAFLYFSATQGVTYSPPSPAYPPGVVGAKNNPQNIRAKVAEVAKGCNKGSFATIVAFAPGY